jgi:hypothetical protein
MRWAGIALCTLAVSTFALLGAGPARASARPTGSAPALSLLAQTPSVNATAPWFALKLGIAQRGIPAADLEVSVTFYSRIVTFSQLQQATSGTPNGAVRLHLPAVPVVDTAGVLTADTCVTVLPDSSATAPPGGLPDSCPVGATTATTLYLDCIPNMGECDDVYPVSVALLRQGSSTPIERFTTFLTYEEPTDVSATGGALRVSFIAPVSGTSAPTVTSELAAHAPVPVTLEVNPHSIPALLARGNRTGHITLDELLSLVGTPVGDQLLSQPYVPIDLTALEHAGLGGEIDAQFDRGAQLLHLPGLHPVGGTWVNTVTNLTTGDASALSSGLAAVHATTLVLNDGSLVPGGVDNYTFAQPFTLDVGHGHVTAVAANDALDSRFTAEGDDPTLAANQLLANLSFVHFENPYLHDPRGVVLVPPTGWHVTSAFLDTLLTGLGTNPALAPVTLDQLLTQVQVGGNGEPSSRKLASGPADTGSISKNSVRRIALGRQDLASFEGALPTHPAVLTSLADALLSAEAQSLGPRQRAAALTSYDRRFSGVLSTVSLAAEHTVTFTSRTAPIPVTVLSSAHYPIRVVVTLQSDKFTFPQGSMRSLRLDRPTTPIRLEAHARTSGDRLPVVVTLRTPDLQLVIAHTTLTVHSTAISIVGIALTVLAGLVLLVWWGRTWRRARQRKPRAH